MKHKDYKQYPSYSFRMDKRTMEELKIWRGDKTWNKFFYKLLQDNGKIPIRTKRNRLPKVQRENGKTLPQKDN